MSSVALFVATVVISITSVLVSCRAVRAARRARSFDELGVYSGYRRTRDPADPVT